MQDSGLLFRARPIWVVVPMGDAFQDDFRRSAQQYHLVEVRVELSLVRFAARDEEDAGSVLAEQALDGRARAKPSQWSRPAG